MNPMNLLKDGTFMFDPEPEVPQDLPHWLIVKEWDPNYADDLLSIAHPLDCPTEVRGDEYGLRNSYEAYSCIFATMVDDAGIDGYFQHVDDPAPDMTYTERVAPGRWPIEPWFHTYHRFEGNEYDSGLRVVEP